MSTFHRFLAVPVLGLALSVTLPAQGSFVNWETPHVHPLDMTPDGLRLLAVNLPDNRLEVFGLASGTPMHEGSIPVGLDPVSVRARTNGEVWIVNHVSDSVSVVDLALGNVVATLDTDDEPADVVFAANPERAFVTCSQANTVLVFDPADLSLAPVRIPIQGEDPRALAVSPSGDEVYAAVFESGNGTTILGGGIAFDFGFPPNVVNHPESPYGGVNPPPNRGGSFEPAIDPGLPAPPRVGLIVRSSESGTWHDDNGGDWTELVSGAKAADSGRPVGWKLLDHDVAIIDAAALTVTYADRLMNICMAIAVNPASGDVGVVGTEARNEIRFEPNLRGRFLRTQLALVDPGVPASPEVVDLNDHLDYSTGSIAQENRDRSLADPRGLVWNAAGTRGYVSGMGSNNVVVVDAAGTRSGHAPTIEVGEGPTGLALDEARERLYVLNKFEGTVSVVDTATELEAVRIPLHDPTPDVIRSGRRHLYDAHETSGLGLTACAGCHVDARMDRIGWDLGDPTGAMKAVTGQNLGANVPGLNVGFQPFHPMKGPMVTQTLQDIIGHEPHHWRGDRDGLEEFDGAFAGLLGDDAPLGSAEMQEFEDFLATIHFPPNPFRTLQNRLPTDLPLPGHFTTGAFGPAGQPLPNGNAVAGRGLFRPPTLLDGGALACVSCHTRPTGAGPDRTFNGASFVPIAPGPNGERHHALVSTDGSTNVSMKIPQLRNLHEKVGFEMTQTENVAGFGFIHDGSVDSLARFVSEPVFTLQNDQQVADLVAFLLTFSGGTNPLGSASNVFEPPGTRSLASHAAVGKQATIADGTAPDPGAVARIDAMLAEADDGDVGVVVKGRLAGEARGWFYSGSNRFQSDRRGETVGRDALQAGAAAGSELTFTVVPVQSVERIGVDRDEDGAYDRDERDAGTDPEDPESRPKVRRAPAGEPAPRATGPRVSRAGG